MNKINEKQVREEMKEDYRNFFKKEYDKNPGNVRVYDEEHKIIISQEEGKTKLFFHCFNDSNIHDKLVNTNNGTSLEDLMYNVEITLNELQRRGALDGIHLYQYQMRRDEYNEYITRINETVTLNEDRIDFREAAYLISLNDEEGDDY